MQNPSEFPTIERLWNSFKKTVLKDAPEIQVTEMRKAFYVGCLGSLQILESVGAADIPEEVAAEHLASLMIECQTFFKQFTDRYNERN